VANEIRSRLRKAAASILTALPGFRGKGRITLLIDRLVTNSSDPESYTAVGALNDGAAFSFDLRPWGQKFAFYYGEWELAHVRALRRLYRGGTFLDIGSSIGLYPVSLGREILARNGSIISVEPVPLNLRRQRVNLHLNGIEHLVTILEVGLGSTDGELRMRTDRGGADNNALIAADGDLAVAIRRLDDVLAELGSPPITLIKMDVEGFEPEVIAGGQETIRRDRPVIFAEFHRGRMAINRFSMDPPWQFLMSCGYRCFLLRGDRFEPLDGPGDFENLYFIPASFGDPNAA
jgi:FkbM family methyltransferase